MNTKPKLKTARLELRLTPEQKDYIKDMAMAHSMTTSEYIISALKLPLPTD